jgi:hypothetical protein
VLYVMGLVLMLHQTVHTARQALKVRNDNVWHQACVVLHAAPVCAHSTTSARAVTLTLTQLPNQDCFALDGGCDFTILIQFRLCTHYW